MCVALCDDAQMCVRNRIDMKNVLATLLTLEEPGVLIGQEHVQGQTTARTLLLQLNHSWLSRLNLERIFLKANLFKRYKKVVSSALD